MSQTITNGTGRKSLANEIDRLQATVAGLGDGVRGAVREATTQAVREAVGELVTEVLTNHDIAAMFRTAQAQPAQAARPKPSPGGGLLGGLTAWLQQPLQLARQAWGAVCRYKGVALAGLAAVAAVAVAVWKAGPLLALAGLAAAAA
jgi:hypothetical protein